MKRQVEEQNEIELRKNPINIFTCHHEDCKDVKGVPYDEFKKHLVEVHGVDGKTKGKKEMTMHMDGSYWFSSKYKWTMENGLVFSQYVRMARPKK